MNVTLGVVADAANYSDDGKLNILGIFHALQTAEVPYSHPVICVVLTITVQEEEKGTSIELDIVLRDPVGDETIASESILLPVLTDSPSGSADHSVVLNTRNMTFQRFGRHHILIRLNGEVKREIPLFILPVGESSQSGTVW